MNHSLFEQAKGFLKTKKNRKIWKRFSYSMAVVVVFVTTYMLILPAITMEKPKTCGKEEHIHTEECYKSSHTETCYVTNFYLMCDKNATEEGLFCDDTEIFSDGFSDGADLFGDGESHTHTDACYQEVMTQNCDYLEHSSEKILACGLEEHQHTKECYETTREEPEEQSLEDEVLQLQSGEDTVFEIAESSEEESGIVQPSEESEVEFQEMQEEPEESKESKEPEEAGADVVFTEFAEEEPEEKAEEVEEIAEADEEIAEADEEVLEADDEADTEDFEEILVLEESMTSASGTDFGPYITAVSVYKTSDGGIHWNLVDEVSDNDSIRVAIRYSLPEGIVTADHKTLYYQLPAGIQLAEQESGIAYNVGNTAVGTYVIGTDGMIRVEFYDEFADGRAFTGSISLEGTISASDVDNSGEIQFAGSGGSLTLKHTYDLHIKKTGTLSADKTTADYTITVSTEKGTEGTISISDYFKDVNNEANAAAGTGSYIRNSFKIEKIDSQGNRSTVYINPSWGTTESGKEKFDLSNLPKLEAGEKYEITYSANTAPAQSGDGYSKVANAVNASSGSSTSNDSSELIVSDKMIEKTGYYDTATGLISWKIIVNNDRRYISSYKLEDILPEGLEVVGEVAVQGESYENRISFTPADTGKVEYVFHNTSERYEVTFQTTAPKEDQKVTNTGTLENYTSSTDVNVTHRDLGVQKTAGNEETGADQLTRYTWNARITLPESALTSFTYVDEILSAVCGETDEGADSHYALVSELKQSIESSLQLRTTSGNLGFSNDQVKFQLKFYNASGVEITDLNSAEPVKKFELVVTPAASNFTGIEINFLYRTIADHTRIAEGETWIYKNIASIPGIQESTASQTYYKRPVLQKQGGVKNPYSDYIQYSDNTKIDYEQSGQLLYYRILLTTEAGSSGDIILTDHLPGNTKLQAGSVELKKMDANGNLSYDTAIYSYDNYGNAIGYYFKDNISYQEIVHEDHTDLVVTIRDGYNSDYNGQNSGNHLAVIYQLSIEDDDSWKSDSYIQKTYTNRVEWNSASSEQTTEVEKQQKEQALLDKTGTQLTDERGDYTNVVEYRVIINPEGLDIDPNQDTLTLIDHMSTGNSQGLGGAYLDMKSIKLYQYVPTAENKCGVEINSSRYQVQYKAGDSTYTMTLTIPDSLACVFVYQYTIDPGSTAGGAQIWNGIGFDYNFLSSENILLKSTSSSATVLKGTVTICKVDEMDYSKLLPGAVFKLEAKKKGESAWQTLSDTLKTNKKGEVELDTSASGALKLETDTLYRLTEVKAPTGYEINEKAYYFLYADLTRQSINALYSEWNADGQFFRYNGQNISQQEISYYGSAGGTLYVPNKFTGISVKKEWTDSEGFKTDPVQSGVKVHLYQHTEKLSGYTVTVNIKNDVSSWWENQWWHPDTQTGKAAQLVAENSSLTIEIPYGTNQSGTEEKLPVYRITYAGHTDIFYAAEFYQNGNTNTAIYTIPAVTSDLTVEIEVINQFYMYQGFTVLLRDYETSYQDAGRIEIGTGFELNEDNNWSYAWDKLESVDAEGNRYYYTIEEDPVPGCTSFYSNTEGIISGEIVVTNVVDETKEEPQPPEKTEITVHKKWFLDGKEIENKNDGSISFDLYQKQSSTKPEEPESDDNESDKSSFAEASTTTPTGGILIGTYTLSKNSAETVSGDYQISGGDWSGTIAELPKDSEGSDGQIIYYTYYVVERDISNYSTTYVNNGDETKDGIVSGTITINNDQDTTQPPEYALPETGGPGTKLYTSAGLLLSILAAALLICKQQKEASC